MFLLTTVLFGLMVVPVVTQCCMTWSVRKASPTTKTVRVTGGDRIAALYAAALLVAGGHPNIVVCLPPRRPAYPRLRTRDEPDLGETLDRHLRLLFPHAPRRDFEQLVRVLPEVPSAWEVRTSRDMPRLVDVVRERDDHPWLTRIRLVPGGQRRLETLLRCYLERHAVAIMFLDHCMGRMDVRVPSRRREYDALDVNMGACFATDAARSPVHTDAVCGSVADADRIVWDERSGTCLRGIRYDDDVWRVSALRAGYHVRDLKAVVSELVPGLRSRVEDASVRRITYGSCVGDQLSQALECVETFLGYDPDNTWQRLCGRNYVNELREHIARGTV